MAGTVGSLISPTVSNLIYVIRPKEKDILYPFYSEESR